MLIDAEPLTRNFETLAEHEVRLAERCCELLFGAHPELVDLFTALHSAASRQMVRETLMYAIDQLNGADWVTSNMASLGAKHVEYEVTEEMYTWYIDALLTAMAELSGALWTSELAAGWRELFGILADLMIAELSEVSSAGPVRLPAVGS
jgi:hemoglobin-like flavoprotein